MVLHRAAIEAALKKESKGQYPPPHVVLDRLMEPLFTNSESESDSEEPIERLEDKDWKNTAIYRHHFMGETELSAILNGTPNESLKNFVTTNKQFTRHMQIEMALTKVASKTELEYFTNLLMEKEAPTEEELFHAHQIAECTYKV